MYKKNKSGIEIDSQAADRENAPRFKGSQSSKKFGKKKARKQAVSNLLNKARKG